MPIIRKPIEMTPTGGRKVITLDDLRVFVTERERLGAPGTTEISAENTMGRKVKTLQAQPETTE